MDYRSYEKRLAYILELIKKNRFQSLQATSKRFGCSTRTLKRMIAHLKDQGHPIRYNRRIKKYFLEHDE